MKTIAKLLTVALLVVCTASALAEVHYVDANSTNAAPPYTNWITAATNIQDAVDAAVAGDEIVVTNGTYATGIRAVNGYPSGNNRVAVDKPLNIRSINGPQSTIIDGGRIFRCVYLTNGVSLSGFTLTRGFARIGGGAYGGTLNNCTLIGNTTSFGPIYYDAYGGGVAYCTLNSCTLASNSVVASGRAFGGGAASCTLNNCTLTENSADNHFFPDPSRQAYGGGAYQCTLNNCTLSGNSFGTVGQGFGSGAYVSTLNNCTLTGTTYGLAHSSTLNNCIVFTTFGENYVSCTLNYCCTTPLPANGVGNITNEPLFLDGNFRLQSNSPCINAGNNSYVTSATDLDGNPRIVGGTVDIGAYEFQAVRYVDVNSTNATPPYSSWSTAATNIQDAVDAAVAGDEIVVTNGVYQTGARDVYGMSNRVAVTKPVAVRSVNGPAVTSIVGYGPSGPEAVRCVYLTNGALLSGFTLTNGATQDSFEYFGFKTNAGGGVWCESSGAVVSNCVLSGNGNFFPGVRFGGGAYSGTLNNCTLVGNSAIDGGGAISSTLNNCTLIGNSAFQGGGVESGTLNNCTLTHNSANAGGAALACTLNNCIAPFEGNSHYLSLSSVNHCWTTDPMFVDTSGWANLRLQSNSPCINAGLNGFAPAGPDLDGNPRIVGGTVDIGAYEYQSLDLIGFGVASNRFGFNITGQSNWAIVLETSSDFANWIPLTTNTLNGSPFPFRDPTPPNLPKRFYRARME